MNANKSIHAHATSQNSYIPSCMKIRLLDLAKFHPKCIFSRRKVDVERSDVAAVVFRECFAATEGSWLRHVTQRATTRPTSSVQLVSWQIFLLLWDTFLGFFVSGSTGITFLDFKRRSKLHDVTTCPSVCPQAPFSKLADFRSILWSSCRCVSSRLPNLKFGTVHNTVVVTTPNSCVGIFIDAAV